MQSLQEGISGNGRILSAGPVYAKWFFYVLQRLRFNQASGAVFEKP